MGLLDDPSYVSNPAEERIANQNVFPFSLGVAGMQVNLMLRYLLAADWWPLVQQQEHQFVTGETRVLGGECHENCSFRKIRARGDAETPSYIVRLAGATPLDTGFDSPTCCHDDR